MLTSTSAFLAQNMFKDLLTKAAILVQTLEINPTNIGKLNKLSENFIDKYTPTTDEGSFQNKNIQKVKQSITMTISL